MLRTVQFEQHSPGLLANWFQLWSEAHVDNSVVDNDAVLAACSTCQH